MNLYFVVSPVNSYLGWMPHTKLSERGRSNNPMIGRVQ